MYTLTKTTDENLLSKKYVEGEVVILGKASANALSSLDQPVAKASQTRNANNTGFVTVTASADALAEMVNESEDVDS